jgi:predicted RNA binding protein YcfA (HicA-like mRNA interferase family)
MARLPTDLSGREVCAALQRAGFVFRRQRGSHVILVRTEPFVRIVVPDHRVVRVGTLRSILANAELGVDEFVDLL